MKQTMKMALDNLNKSFDINAELKKSLKHMLKDKDLEAKFDADDIELELDEIRGTRRPGNRAERRKATAHAKNSRKELASYADDPWYGIEFNPKTGKVKRWAGFAVENKVKNRKTRYDGKNLAEERRDYFDEGARAFEKDDEAFDFDSWFFEYENGETWEQMVARKNFNGESAWNWQLSMMRAPGFYDAKVLIRLNNEIEVIKAKKQALLEEYAEKMERLNEKLRDRLNKVAVLEGKEPPYQF